MAFTEQDITQALQSLTDPNTGATFSSAKAFKNIKLQGTEVHLDLELGYPAKSQWPALVELVSQAARTVAGVGTVTVTPKLNIVPHAVQRGVQLLPGVKNIVAVASGKGGVGKSTTAANLALALAAEGARVGLLDADIYGPSQPMMMGIEGRPDTADGKTMEPMENHGVQVMSIGFLVDGRPGHDLARPHGDPGLGATAASDQLERAGLPRRGHAPRHRRHPAHPEPAGALDRCRGGDHSARHCPPGRQKGHQDV